MCATISTSTAQSLTGYTQVAVSAFPQVGPRLVRPSIPVAGSGRLHSIAVRCQQACARPAAAEGTCRTSLELQRAFSEDTTNIIDMSRYCSRRRRTYWRSGSTRILISHRRRQEVSAPVLVSHRGLFKLTPVLVGSKYERNLPAPILDRECPSADHPRLT